MYAFLRPIRSPTLLLIRMNAADTSASRAIADWTPLTVVPRSVTTAEIDTFIRDVSTTRTNIAAASRRASRRSNSAAAAGACAVAAVMRPPVPPVPGPPEPPVRRRSIGGGGACGPRRRR